MDILFRVEKEETRRTCLLDHLSRIYWRGNGRSVPCILTWGIAREEFTVRVRIHEMDLTE